MKSLIVCLLFTFVQIQDAFCCLDQEANSTSTSAKTSEKTLPFAKPNSEQKRHPYSLLIFGGGYSPSGNQVSLESNVKYFRRIRSSIGLGEAEMKTFFADGRSSDRDLQFFDPAFRIPEANLILAELVGSTRGIANQYRSNDLNPDDSSSLSALDKWIKHRKVQEGNQTNLIYFTGHGGKGDKKTPHNTTAYLWNNSKLKVPDLTKKLDQLPKEQPCIFVMVQCYSGGFANLIFKDGDPKKGLSEHPRAGFFATVENRVAAGCTPDIREKNYREYSTRFWEGLCGESRVGKKVTKPDFNKDGKTSFSEAHAYVVLHSDTIDIPIKTSDTFLRRFSALTPPRDSQKEDSCDPELFSAVDKELKELLRGASRESRVVVNGLSRKLKLKEQKRHEETKKLAESLKKKKAEIVVRKKKIDEERSKIKRDLSARLRKEWPELKNFHHPTVTALYRKPKSVEVSTLVNSDGLWTRYRELSEKSKKLESERFSVEKQEVLTMRLIRELETIVLAKNLSLLNPADIIGSYDKLTALEHSKFPD
jgi:hypothetical protein